MDKRTLFFVVALGAALFLVNTFFEQQNIQARKEWLQQEEARNKLKEEELTRTLKERAVAPTALPLTRLYGDERGEQFLTTAVVGDGTVLTAAWQEKMPQTVYASTSGAMQLYTIVSESDGFALYSRSRGTFAVAHLPDFGTYDLQFIGLEHAASARVTAGEVVDGDTTSFAHALEDAKRALQKEVPPLPEKAVVLIKSEESWKPVALYTEGDRLVLLEETAFPTAVVRESATVSGERPAERFYVLENGYQQLVFSNYGGALVEINLPYEGKSHPKSVVKPIAVGREMVEKYPDNALFPAHSYSTPGTSSSGPFIEHSKGVLGGYYPLLRRDLIIQGKRKSVRVAPEFYALNIISKYPELAELPYRVTYFDKEKIIFEASQGSRRRITKTYTLNSEAAPYCFDVAINIEGDSNGLWVTTGIPEVEIISGASAPVLKYRMTRQGKGEVAQVTLPTAGEATVSTSIFPDWLSNGNGFFGVIVDPLTEMGSGYRAQYVSGNEAPSRLLEIGQEHSRFEAKSLPGYMMALPLKGRGGTTKLRVFAGPYSKPILKSVDTIFTNSATGDNPDYIGCQTFHGWFAFISEPFAKFLFLLMTFFHWGTGSWAFSIVLLTVALRIMLYPLNNWSARSMARMQEVSPKLQELQKKYKHDPKKMQLETMNLYRESGVNPLSGCFPLLIQLPFLLGMFDLLKSSFQLRGAAFIPGWIDNLAAPDVLFQWDTPLLIVGNSLHLLPILTGLAMFIQMKMSSPLPKDKSLWTDQQRQQRAMSTFMPLLLIWVFYNAPSGLNIYWISSTALGALQQWWTQKKLKVTPKVEVVQEAGKRKRNKGRRS